MARNRVTSSGFSFVNGTRQITVTNPLFAGFTLESIRLIINETQKVVYTSSMQKSNVSVAGNVITLANSFPVLVTGDQLTIEMDMGFVGADAVAVEINSGKTVISQALTLRGQPSTISDSFNQMADKIEDIVGNITVTPLVNNPSWHDLAYEIGQYVDFTNTFAFAILLDPTVTSIALSGANAYKISDGRIFTTDQTVTFGANEAGRENLVTKYVIYRRTSPYMTQNFGSYSPSLVRLILGAYNLNMDWSTITFNGVRTGFLISDSQLKNPIIFNADRKLLSFQGSHFANNPALNNFVFPPFTDDATDAEKVLSIPFSFMNTNTGLHSIGFPQGLKTLTLNQNSFFTNSSLTNITFPKGLEILTLGQNALSLQANLISIIFPNTLKTLNTIGNFSLENLTILPSLIFPTGLETLIITGSGALAGTPNLTYIFLPNPSTTLNVSAITTATAVTKLELENNWNRTVSLTFANLTAQNTKDFMLDRLVDKRFDGTNPSVVDTSTTSPIVTDTNGNGNFLALFRVGDTINIAGGGNRTIASIQSRNELTLTANAATTGTGQAYNMNKTLTLSATVKTALATAFGANWADPYTAKGWTIA